MAGWIHLTDGPGAGKDFHAQRTPAFLRVVVDRHDNWNVLDLIEDEPTREEEIFVYRRVSSEHRCYRNGNRELSGWHCNYVNVPIDTGQKASLRYNHRWQQWATAQVGQPA